MAKAQIACDAAKAQLCSRNTSTYDKYRSGFDLAHSGVANAASVLRREAGSLKSEGCPQLESPNPIPVVMASMGALKI